MGYTDLPHALHFSIAAAIFLKLEAEPMKVSFLLKLRSYLTRFCVQKELVASPYAVISHNVATHTNPSFHLQLLLLWILQLFQTEELLASPLLGREEAYFAPASREEKRVKRWKHSPPTCGSNMDILSIIEGLLTRPRPSDLLFPTLPLRGDWVPCHQVNITLHRNKSYKSYLPLEEDHRMAMQAVVLLAWLLLSQAS